MPNSWSFPYVLVESLASLGHTMDVWRRHGVELHVSPETLQGIRDCGHLQAESIVAGLVSRPDTYLVAWLDVLRDPGVLSALNKCDHPRVAILIDLLKVQQADAPSLSESDATPGL
ncbi:MAG: hypothetical protein ACREPQ_14525 [Rhodanobacter sp.]